jgi:hypothetical protein
MPIYIVYRCLCHLKRCNLLTKQKLLCCHVRTSYHNNQIHVLPPKASPTLLLSLIRSFKPFNPGKVHIRVLFLTAQSFEAHRAGKECRVYHIPRTYAAQEELRF